MPQHSLTLGIDVGDHHSHLCLLDTETGEVIEESRIATTPQTFERRFVGVEPMRVAFEAGTHSPWISRLLGGCGHEVWWPTPASSGSSTPRVATTTGSMP